MNFRDLLLPVTLALITTFAIQYFFFGGSGTAEQAQSGQSFTAPKTKQELKPRNTEVDFIDAARDKEAVVTKIETKGARMTFSSDGAILDQLEFKQVSCGAGSLSTIVPSSDTEKENRSFMLAFNEKTPYFYSLTNKVETDDRIELTYQAMHENTVVEKKFVVYKNTYKIDLDIKLTGLKEDKLQDIRIFWPSPDVKALGKDDLISAIANDEKGSIIKIALDKIDIEQGRFAPTLFGTDDRYFVHAMVEDTSQFVSRAYHKMAGKTQLISILEGPSASSVKKDATEAQWKISFYFGPKEEGALSAVDPRLEQTLDYSGWLAPISKFLLYILKLLYSFFLNFGLAIIALTILVKLVLLPFTYRAEESMKKRAEFDKKLRYIQQKFKDNPDQLAQERAELIQKYGMPGLGGCFPLLLQLPIFVALSRVLSSSIELYRAPFFWIPDLSARDPYYILSILIVVAMAAQALTGQGVDNKQRISTLVMSLVVGAVTTSLAAGLSLYICTFTLLGVLQVPLMKWFKRS
jgi:YidC/Oxa1 family membrane protein insertase